MTNLGGVALPGHNLGILVKEHGMTGRHVDMCVERYSSQDCCVYACSLERSSRAVRIIELHVSSFLRSQKKKVVLHID